MAIAGLILAGLSVVVIPFIAIIAAIAIPAFLTTHRIDTDTHHNITKTYPIEKPIIEEPTEVLKSYEDNENSAIASLKDLCSNEAVWRQQDVDGNGIKDYWTYDVSCFNRMYRADGVTKVNFIDTSFAMADTSRADDDVFGFGFPAIEPWSTEPEQFSSAPKSGYYFQAMELDENRNLYNQNEVGENKIKVTNNTKFAFVAYPETYGSTGINTFIVNENGTVYKKDTGGHYASKVLNWPGEDPTQQGWQPTE